jgi:protein ImuB
MFAVLHIADFPLQAVLRTEAGMAASQPAALFAGTNKKSVLLSANAVARRAGVEIGMTAAQALARCPHLIIRSPCPSAEAEAEAALLAVSFTLSPTIEKTAAGICTVDLKGSDRAQRLPLAADAIKRLRNLGLPASAGLARTPLLALYAARFAETHSAEGVHHVSDEKNFLAPLPLSTANPSPELAGVFAGWGLRTLGDLLALPRDEIIRRFGADGYAFWNRAHGGEPRPLHPVTLPAIFSARMEFEDEIETLEPLLFVLRRFLDRLALELSAAQQVAAELNIELQLADETRHTRGFRLPEPTGDPEILFRTLHTHLESLRTEASIAAVSLRIEPTRPLVRQQGLFETGLRDPHGFAETLARVVAVVGSERVGTPQLEDSHRPDAFKLKPPIGVIPPPAEPPLHAPLGLPLRRFRPPLPVKLEFSLAGQVADLAGQLSEVAYNKTHNPHPTYLWTERFHGVIAQLRGPWQSSGHWWQSDQAWRRTEWDVALAGGGLYRLVLVGDAWFVEGEYD